MPRERKRANLDERFSLPHKPEEVLRRLLKTKPKPPPKSEKPADQEQEQGS